MEPALVEATGLDGTPVQDYPKKEVQPEQKPIDLLRPGTDLHHKILTYLLKRLDSSEQAMTTFHSRWNRAEKIMQIYINRDATEDNKKARNRADGPVEATEIVLPYAYATVSTIVTYLLHTFCGRKPMFTLGARDGASVEASRLQEQYLQYQAEHIRLIATLRQFFNDGETYGLGILRVEWTNERKPRTRWVQTQFGPAQERAEALVYQGNMVMNIDPYLFFPDPSVPMSRVNTDGEFVFWRTYLGKHILLNMERAGYYKWVQQTSQSTPTSDWLNEGNTSRGTLSEGVDANRMAWLNNSDKNLYKVDQGSVEIIPAELGLGDSQYPEKWIFTILNRKQIVQAEPFHCDHGKHPVVVSEPYSQGYTFGQPSLLDYISPVQDLMSWMMNSHIFNVRSILDNILVVDPARVDVGDLLKKKGKGPRIIRLKNAAIGSDAKTALYQLPLQDVTQSHIGDMAVLQRIGDTFSAVNDNLRGLNSTGGRKTATEVRQAGEASASRLAAHAMGLSATSMTDLLEMLVLNNQQYLTDEFAMNVLGQDASQTQFRVKPQMLVGDFNFPVHDGTLPMDKVALLDVWKEIFLVASKDPLLAQQYDRTKMFEYIAKLGGVQDLSTMKVSMRSPQQIASGVESGSLVPANMTADQLMSGLV